MRVIGFFGLGREMMQALEGRPTGRPLKLSVGIANVVPWMDGIRPSEPRPGGRRPVTTPLYLVRRGATPPDPFERAGGDVMHQTASASTPARAPESR